MLLMDCGEALLDEWSAITGLFLFVVLDGEHALEERMGERRTGKIWLASILSN